MGRHSARDVVRTDDSAPGLGSSDLANSGPPPAAGPSTQVQFTQVPSPQSPSAQAQSAQAQSATQIPPPVPLALAPTVAAAEFDTAEMLAVTGDPGLLVQTTDHDGSAIPAADLLARLRGDALPTTPRSTRRPAPGAPGSRVAAARARKSKPVWRRNPTIPAVAAVALAVWGAGDALHFIGGTGAGADRTHSNVAVDLSALAANESGDQNGTTQVSRAKRDPHSSVTSTTVAGEPVLPARPSLPAVTDGKTVAGTWIRPGEGMESSCFCMRWGVMHEGIDLAGALGSPIVAVGDGVVVAAGPAEGFGHWIVIQHSNGDVSIYGHMYSVLVSVGEHVTAGEHIANVGADGEATGPHLHFGVRLGGMNGPYTDPIPWLKARGITIGAYDPNA